MSIQSRTRSVFLRALNGSDRAATAGPLPDWSAHPYRVLFLRDDRVGDMIASLEIMRAIAQSSPSITLDVLASPANASLARELPWVGDVLVHDHTSLLRSARLRSTLARRGYDAVVDGRVFVNSVSLRRALLLRSTRARWRIGLAGQRNGEIYNVPIHAPDLPYWIDYLVALAAPFGIEPRSQDWRPRLRRSEAARADAERRWQECGSGRPRVLVNISAGHLNRRWPDERWMEVLRGLRERMPQACLSVLAMPPDRQSAERLAESVRGRALILELDDTIATVAAADLVITPDTAISHIASAFERSTVTLLRKGFERLVPYRTPGRNVFGDDPHSLRGLHTSPVLAALDDLLAEIAHASGV